MNREQRRAQLSSKHTAPTKDIPLRADIAINKDTGKVVIIYGQHINNVSYTPDQLESHIRGLAGAGRMIKPGFMPEIKA